MMMIEGLDPGNLNGKADGLDFGNHQTVNAYEQAILA
jgi:hypothetical protein